MTDGGSGVGAVIDGFRARTGPEAASSFARAVVGEFAPSSKARAKALLWACARLATFGMSVGLEPTAVVLLHPSVIERFVLVGCDELGGAARRTVRTNLRAVAARVVSGGPGPVALSRERAKAPYTDAQIAAYVGLAEAQPTLARQMRALGLICLGAGAGLVGADLRRVRGDDVVARSGGVLVDVGGRRPRTVPVLGVHQDRLIRSARWAGTNWIVGGVDPDRRNVTTPLIASLAGGADLPRLDIGRLRATWLAAMAARLGLAAFMDAAGISCSQRLGDVIAALPRPAEADTVVLLGGAR